jgi:hypothetical protein
VNDRGGGVKGYAEGAAVFAMCGGASPRIGCGFPYHSGPHRVKLGVSQGRPEVRLIERAGIVRRDLRWSRPRGFIWIS